jgi:hypothetical protein
MTVGIDRIAAIVNFALPFVECDCAVPFDMHSQFGPTFAAKIAQLPFWFKPV